ncbi:MAG: pyruvate dehydrogenase (acetyl-transferring) E1 component subunit alpha [Alphaproteobacteria bacterium]
MAKAMKKQQSQPHEITPPDPSKFSTEDLQDLYYQMLLIRRFEEKAGQMYGMGKIAGFCHLYNGQEAVVVGMQSVLKEDDSVITAYRDHGHMLACGMDPKGVMAELFGKADGYSKGKGGSMHMFSREKNFMGGHGIVGANVPLGAGIAFAHQYRDTDALCLAYYGDGSANQGQIYETYNMAALWKLPIVFIIENNKYAMGTSIERHAANPNEMYNRASVFGIPGFVVDGMNVLEVQEAGHMATEHVRSGNGPILLEMRTYRYRGHSMSDPAKYRSKDEVDSVKSEADPLDYIKDLLSKRGIKDEDLKSLNKKVKDIVAESVEFAESSPEPDPSELYTDILIEDEQ